MKENAINCVPDSILMFLVFFVVGKRFSKVVLMQNVQEALGKESNERCVVFIQSEI